MAGNAGTEWKYIPVARLRTILAQLPDAASIKTNTVGNLMVIEIVGQDGEQDVYRFRGYIDLLTEELVLSADESEYLQ